MDGFHEVGDGVFGECRSEEIAIVEGELVIEFFVGTWVRHYAQFIGVEQRFADLHHTRDETHQLALYCSFEFVVVFLMVRLGVFAANVDLDEDWVLVQKINLLEDLFEITMHIQIVASPDFVQ